MRAYCWFIFPLIAANCTRLHFRETTTKCVIDTPFYWQVFADHFSETSLITVNILHADDYHNAMSFLVDLVLRYTQELTKLRKPIYVKHTDVSARENVRRDDFLEGIDGRTAYIILVWNQQILSKFLDLAPDEVVRDRRGKYVVLFAYNHPDFCYEFDGSNERVLVRFWNQFGVVNACINVPCSCGANEIYRYHPFLRRIDVLNVSDLNKNPSLLTVSLNDLHQYPLKVSMFDRPPTALKGTSDPLSQKQMEYSGVDGLIVHSLSTSLNFHLVYSEADYYKYGRIKNGTAVGSLGDVVYRRVHLSGNGRFVTDYGTDAIEFTLPYQSDIICFIVPKSQRIPQWVMLFHSFSASSWLALIGVFALAALVWRGLRGSFVTLYAIFTNTPTTLASLSTVQKLFLGFCMSYNLIVNGIFQGSLTTSFSTVSYYPDVTNLDALIQSELPISTNLDLWKSDNGTHARILTSRQKFTNGEWALQRAAFHRDVAAAERRLDADYYIKKQFLDEEGVPLVYIVDKCVNSYFISFIVPRGSPFLPAFDSVIAKLNQAGLTNKWYKDIINDMVFTASKGLRSKDDNRSLNLSDVQSAFYILLIGLSLSLVVFLGEVWHCKRNKWTRVVLP